MIEAILPGAAAVAEARDDAAPGELFAAEEALMGRAVERRRREFACGRECAHRALAQLGEAPGPVLAGERGEPLWPADVVGSITHCRGYSGCAVGRAGELAAIGVDAEPHQPLPERLIGSIARPEERGSLEELARAEPDVHWDRLLFSAKETVYKAWYPLTGRWLGFEDSALSFDRAEHSFSARLLVPGPVVDGTEISTFDGRWLVADGLILAAIAIAA